MRLVPVWGDAGVCGGARHGRRCAQPDDAGRWLARAAARRLPSGGVSLAPDPWVLPAPSISVSRGLCGLGRTADVFVTRMPQHP